MTTQQHKRNTGYGPRITFSMILGWLIGALLLMALLSAVGPHKAHGATISPRRAHPCTAVAAQQGWDYIGQSRTIDPITHSTAPVGRWVNGHGRTVGYSAAEDTPVRPSIACATHDVYGQGWPTVVDVASCHGEIIYYPIYRIWNCE